MTNIDKIDLEMLQKLITEDYKLKATQGKEVILFFGRTGAGTSTLISYLLGATFQRKKNILLKLNHNIDQPTPQISDGLLKGTLLPQAYKLMDNVYCIDTPGIADAVIPTQDLFLKLALQIAIQNSASIKAIIVVVSEMQIETLRGLIFADLARQIFSVSKGDQYRNSLHFFVTKKKTNDDIIEVLKDSRDLYQSQANYFETHENKFNQAKRFREVEVFIQNFLSTKKIFVFDPSNHEQRENILDQLKKSQTISKSQIGNFITLNQLKLLLNRIAQNKFQHLKALEQILKGMVENFGLESESTTPKGVESCCKALQAAEEEKIQAQKGPIQTQKEPIQCQNDQTTSQVKGQDPEAKKLDD